MFHLSAPAFPALTVFFIGIGVQCEIEQQQDKRAAAAKRVRLEETEGNFVTRLVPEEADAELMDYKYNSGFFFEKDIDSLAEIAGVCGLRCQTLTYFGVKKEDFREFLEEVRPAGVDRIVPMGKSMDFSLIWDGYDLIRQMSRRVTLL